MRARSVRKRRAILHHLPLGLHHLQLGLPLCALGFFEALLRRGEALAQLLQLSLFPGLLLLARCHVEAYQDAIGDDARPRLGEALDLVVAKVLGDGRGPKAARPADGLAFYGKGAGLLAALQDTRTLCPSHSSGVV